MSFKSIRGANAVKVSYNGINCRTGVPQDGPVMGEGKGGQDYWDVRSNMDSLYVGFIFCFALIFPFELKMAAFFV